MTNYCCFYLFSISHCSNKLNTPILRSFSIRTRKKNTFWHKGRGNENSSASSVWGSNQFLFLICKEKNDCSTLLCYHSAAVRDELKYGAVFIRKYKLDNNNTHMYIFRKTTEKSMLFQAILYFPSCITVFSVWVTHLSQKFHIKQHKSNVEERCKTIQEVELQMKIFVIMQVEIHGLRKKCQLSSNSYSDFTGIQTVY